MFLDFVYGFLLKGMNDKQRNTLDAKLEHAGMKPEEHLAARRAQAKANLAAMGKKS